MTAQRPPDPTENNVRTFYQTPLLNRVTGHYTVAWKSGDRVATIRRRNRIEDMEGFRPSWKSALRLPETVRTYFEAKRRSILRKPVPFLVHEAIDHLATLVGPGTRVLEFGGGNSTLWFLERGADVVTIEHSEEWAREIRAAARERHGDGATLNVIVAEGDSALEAARGLQDHSLDLALVDCMNAYTWRRDAVEACLPKVADGGTLCLDNSDHPNNWPAVTLLGRDARRRFTGYAPMCPVVTQTSFWEISARQESARPAA